MSTSSSLSNTAVQPDARVLAWRNRLTPMWKRIGGGCHLNRPIDAMIKQAGFRVDRVETGYIKGPRPFIFLFNPHFPNDHTFN